MKAKASQIIAVNIRKQRRLKGMTMEQLAEKLGISYGTMSNIECNRTSPQVDKIHNIAKGLGVPLVKLFEGLEE